MPGPIPEAQKQVNKTLFDRIVKIEHRVEVLESDYDKCKLQSVQDTHQLIKQFSDMLDAKFAERDAKEKEQDARLQALEDQPKNVAYARQNKLISWLLGLLGLAISPYIISMIQAIIGK